MINQENKTVQRLSKAYRELNPEKIIPPPPQRPSSSDSPSVNIRCNPFPSSEEIFKLRNSFVPVFSLETIDLKIGFCVSFVFVGMFCFYAYQSDSRINNLIRRNDEEIQQVLRRTDLKRLEVERNPDQIKINDSKLEKLKDQSDILREDIKSRDNRINRIRKQK